MVELQRLLHRIGYLISYLLCYVEHCGVVCLFIYSTSQVSSKWISGRMLILKKIGSSGYWVMILWREDKYCNICTSYWGKPKRWIINTDRDSNLIFKFKANLAHLFYTRDTVVFSETHNTVSRWSLQSKYEMLSFQSSSICEFFSQLTFHEK